MSEKPKSRAPTKAIAERQRIERILRPFPAAEREYLRKTLALYRKGECPRWRQEKLEEFGLISGSPVKEQDIPSTVDNQRALSEVLTRHFAGRISLEFSQQQISRWRLGVAGHGTPAGTPPAPARKGLRYDVAAWIEWVERYIQPTHGTNGHAVQGPREPSIFEKASEAEAERQIIERNRAKRAEEVELGNFIPVSEHFSRLKIIGQVLNQAITESIERNIVQTLLDAAKVLPIDDTKMAEFKQAIQQACEAASDAQRRAVAGAMTDAGERQP